MPTMTVLLTCNCIVSISIDSLIPSKNIGDKVICEKHGEQKIEKVSPYLIKSDKKEEEK